jgi:alpha-beta hydrolase superfamily lysophospholipase
MVETWTITGSHEAIIYGDTHFPDGPPVGVVLIAHGFKGYKDYGMFPRIAETMAAAGAIAHRFNFSHSGMTNSIETFERPDLFEADTWNKQVHDMSALVDAVEDGTLPGAGLPQVLFGHSRGGVTVLLSAGRPGALNRPPAGVVAASAPSTCLSLTAEEIDRLDRESFLESPSSRTGQTLRVGRVYLDEQRADPDGHDVLGAAAQIACPLLVIHGADDPTVPAAAAQQIVEAAGGSAQALLIAGGDHVFNTPNPMGDAPASPQLQELLDATKAFCLGCFD